MRARYFSIFLVFLLAACRFVAQNTIHTLQQKLALEKDPDLRAAICNSIALKAYGNEPGLARTYVNKGLALAKDSGVIIDLQSTVGLLYRLSGDYDSAIVILSRSLNYQRRANSTLKIIENLTGLGIVYSLQSEYNMALRYFLESLTLLEKLNEPGLLARCYNNIANVYYSTDNPAKALEYYQLALKIKRSTKEKDKLESTLINIGNIYVDLDKSEEALKYLEDALKISAEKGNKSDMAYIYLNISHAYRKMKNFPKALDYANRSNEINHELNDSYSQVGSLIDIAAIEADMKNFPKAEAILTEALEEAKKRNTLQQLNDIYAYFSELNQAQGKHKAALEYYKLYVATKDSIFNEDTKNEFNELLAKYETEKKERQIQKLKTEKTDYERSLYKQRMNTYLIITIFACALLILLIFYYLYMSRQRKKYQQEKEILQQKQQKEILETIVKTQEEERKKIAGDIHDSLGQLLTISQMNINVAMQKAENNGNKEVKESLQNSFEATREALLEAKNISSQLVPPSIRENGLSDAIRTICERSNKTTGLHIKLSFNGLPKKLDELMETTIYRICQELINNTVKHSKAKEASLQLFYRDNQIVIHMEDDGVGFDFELDKQKGIGLINMGRRVKMLNGSIDIETPGKGTIIIIEIPY